MRSLFLATAILAGAASWPAQACTIRPPGTPAEEARLAVAAQTEAMGEATTIFLAEMTDRQAIAVSGSPVPGLRAVLTPRRAIRGEAPRGSLALQHTEYTSCGLSPWSQVLFDEPGQTYVVFATRAEPRQADLVAVVRRDRLVQPELLAALDR